MPHHPLADALLLITSECAHCPAMIEALGKLLKAGQIGRLEMINVSLYPEIAEANHVRSVPWLRLGSFELHGAFSKAELADWARHASDGQGWTAYYAHLLETNRLTTVIDAVHETPHRLQDLVTLLDASDTPMSVRIGIGAVIEEFSGSEPLQAIIPGLGTLTHSDNAQLRADACHYLGLSEDTQAAEHIRPLLDDEDDSVREIAAESLALVHGERLTQEQPG